MATLEPRELRKPSWGRLRGFEALSTTGGPPALGSPSQHPEGEGGVKTRKWDP